MIPSGRLGDEDRIDARDRHEANELLRVAGRLVEHVDDFLDLDVERLAAGDDQAVGAIIDAERSECCLLAWKVSPLLLPEAAEPAEASEAETAAPHRLLVAGVHVFAERLREDLGDVDGVSVLELDRARAFTRTVKPGR